MANSARRLLVLSLLFSLALFYPIAVTVRALEGPEDATTMSWPYLNVSTERLKLSFDVEHGGVLTSLRYDDVEMLMGAGGRWGSVDLVRQLAAPPPSGGDICAGWGSLLKYQYDEGNVSGSTSVSDTKKEVVVSIGTNLGVLSWEISKHAPKLSLKITPFSLSGMLPYYLYFPLAKEDARLDIHTFKGWRSAADTAYCDSAYGTSTLVRYVVGGGKKGTDGLRMLISSSRPVPVAYYGTSSDATWLLHYPVPPAGDYSLKFHFQRKKQDI